MKGIFPRQTEQRRVILAELQKLHSHPTAPELYLLVRKILPNISLGTVYRNLEQLHEKGLVRKIFSPGGEARFDGDLSGHQHVRCSGCGRIYDLQLELPELSALAAKNAAGFEISGYELEFVGLCPECRPMMGSHPSSV